MKQITVVAFGLLLGAAALAVSAHVPSNSIMLSQQPVPVCPPDNPNCNIQAVKK